MTSVSINLYYSTYNYFRILIVKLINNEYALQSRVCNTFHNHLTFNRTLLMYM